MPRRRRNIPQKAPIITLDEILLEPDEFDDPGLAWLEGVADDLDPTHQHLYEEYADDPLGFAKDILKVELTDDQKSLLLAVLKYEVVIVLSATGVGKTFALAVLAVWLYKTRKEIEVYTIAAPPEKNLKRLLWGEIGRLINKNEELFADDTITSLLIIRSPKEQIEGLGIPTSGTDEEIEAKFSGKHQRNLVGIVDEADAVVNPVFKGIDGWMSGGEFVRQIMCLNPKKREGIPYDRVKDGRAYVIEMTAFNHPNVITGDKTRVPGAVTREATVRRINEWSVALQPGQQPDQDCFKVPDFLVGEIGFNEANIPFPPLPAGWRRITDPQMYYKVLGKYPTMGSGELFDEVWIQRAIERKKQFDLLNQGRLPDVDPLMGQDVSDMGKDYNVTILRYGGYVVVHDRWNGVDPGITADRAAVTYKEKGVSFAFVDSTGVGAAVPGIMNRHGCPNVVPVRFGDKSTGFTEEGEFEYIRDEAYWAVRIWLRDDPTAMLPDDKRLIDAMRIVTYSTPKGKLKIMLKDDMIKKLEYSPDELDGLVLTFSPLSNWFGSI